MAARQRRAVSPKQGGARLLDERGLIKAALQQIRAVGVDKLSMRGLARELGVSPMALYNYVPSKEALLARLGEAAPALAPTIAARRKTAGPLREQDIVDCGLRLVRTGGAHSLSMRSLALELNVSVMALYHHVPSKEVLLDRLKNAILMRVPTPPPNGEKWGAQMRAYALEGVMLLSEYPGLLQFGVRREPTTEDRRLTRYGISILLDAGFDARGAALAIQAYHTHIVGLVLLHDQPRGQARSPSGSRQARKPDVAAVAQQLGQLSFRDSMEFGIDTVLHGLRFQLAQANTGTRTSRARRSRA